MIVDYTSKPPVPEQQHDGPHMQGYERVYAQQYRAAGRGDATGLPSALGPAPGPAGLFLGIEERGVEVGRVAAAGAGDQLGDGHQGVSNRRMGMGAAPHARGGLACGAAGSRLLS